MKKVFYAELNFKDGSKLHAKWHSCEEMMMDVVVYGRFLRDIIDESTGEVLFDHETIDN